MSSVLLDTVYVFSPMRETVTGVLSKEAVVAIENKSYYVLIKF